MNRSKKEVSIVLIAILLLAAGSVSLARYSGGTGEPNDPYRIAKPNDLNDIGNHIEDFNQCFVMVNDINLVQYTGTQFNIIGNDVNAFAGVFDGNGYTISNFTYVSSGVDDIGLIGYVDGPNAEIRNLGIIDPYVNSGARWHVGSLVGSLQRGVVTGCYVQGGSISGRASIGGLVGFNEGVISNCWTAITVSGQSYVGGLVGTNGWDGNISNCYAISIISGNDSIGGLVGDNHQATISNCYAICTITGDEHIGGLVGTDSFLGTILNCYAAGVVDGNLYVGGLVGMDVGCSYTGCFWDSEVNPDVNGLATGSDPNVIGKTTAEMKTESTFADAGWDFVEVWGIGEGQTYPYLRKYSAGDLNHDGIVDWRDFAIFALHWLEGGEI